MICELCGKYITKGNKICVEGSIVIACDKCSKYGEFVDKIDLKIPKKKVIEKEREYEFELDFDEEIVDNYGLIVRRAREEKNMKQEDLAKRINEPVSVIKRIESERIELNTKIAKKIENVLNIRLIEKSEDEDIDMHEKDDNEKITLGDIIVVRKKRGKRY